MSLRELASQAKRKGGKGRHGRLLTFKEIRRIKKRGYEAERELVRKLRINGFKAVRVPVSAPSGEPLPDVFATKGDFLLAFEVKAPRAERAYFPREQVEKLFQFLNFFEPFTKKMAIVAAKFPRRWVFKMVEKPDDYVVSRDEQSSFNPEIQ